MFKFLKKTKGQSTMEYAILIIIIIGALLSIQVYIKRGIQGRLKSATDDIGEQFSTGNTNARLTTRSFSRTQDTFNAGITRSQMLANESTNILTDLNIINVDQEYWGGGAGR